MILVCQNSEKQIRDAAWLSGELCQLFEFRSSEFVLPKVVIVDRQILLGRLKLGIELQAPLEILLRRTEVPLQAQGSADGVQQIQIFGVGLQPTLKHLIASSRRPVLTSRIPAS